MAKKRFIPKDKYIEWLRKKGKYNPKKYFEKKEKLTDKELRKLEVPECCIKCEKLNRKMVFCADINCKKYLQEVN